MGNEAAIAATFNAEFGFAAGTSNTKPVGTQRARRRFTALDGQALPLSVVSEDREATIARVVEVASSLVGPDRADAHVEFIATRIAIEQEKLDAFNAFRDQLIFARDLPAVAMMNRTIESTAKVMCQFVREHRAALVGDRRDVVVIGHANSIHFGPGKK